MTVMKLRVQAMIAYKEPDTGHLGKYIELVKDLVLPPHMANADPAAIPQAKKLAFWLSEEEWDNLGLHPEVNDVVAVEISPNNFKLTKEVKPSGS